MSLSSLVMFVLDLGSKFWSVSNRLHWVCHHGIWSAAGVGVPYSPTDCVQMGASPGMPSYWLYCFMQGSVIMTAKSIMRLCHQHCHSCAVNGLQLYVLHIKFSGIFNLVTFRVFCALVYVLYFMMCSTSYSLSSKLLNPWNVRKCVCLYACI
jgi:hypothetical protein